MRGEGKNLLKFFHNLQVKNKHSKNSADKSHSKHTISAKYEGVKEEVVMRSGTSGEK